jgi:outer membrane protein assembly factor BamB
MIKLRGGDLARVAAWKVPEQEDLNLDFQASPTLFKAGKTPMVGACNKNGVFYAFAADNIGAGPVWRRRLGVSAPKGKLAFCGGSALWDNDRKLLLVGANRKTATATEPGGVYALNPSTGRVVWYTPLAGGPVVGNPSLDGAGVLAVPTFDRSAGAQNALYLIDESNGAILRTIPYPEPLFAQPVFAAGELLVVGPTLQAYRPSANTVVARRGP